MQLNVLNDLAEAMKALDGKKTINVEEGVCAGCDSRFSGCWMLPESGGLRLATQCSNIEPFLVQPARSSRSIAAIDPALLRLCSSLVVRITPAPQRIVVWMAVLECTGPAVSDTVFLCTTSTDFFCVPRVAGRSLAIVAREAC
jgi:hypothetical protein